ncbi:MAG: uroporphyrinogen decarboxylase family protein [Phycisphaerales bacterium]
MNNRRRVLTALAHQQPDAITYNIRFTKSARARMAAYYGDTDFEWKLGNCFTGFRPHPKDSRYWLVGPDIWEDKFGVCWDRTVDKDIGIPCNQLIGPDNMDDYEWPDPHDQTRYDFIRRAIPDAKDNAILVSLGFALFERAWTLVGMEELLMYMLTNKDFVSELLDEILEYDLGVIEHACSLDMDIFRFGDDWGHPRGLIMGIDLWRESIKPRIKRMYEHVNSKGKQVMIHCCGKVDELFPELIECGLDIFNPFQPEVMDVFESKRRYGDRLSFYGGISTQKTLPYGAIEKVRSETKHLIEVVGENGGYIASPAHDIPADAKPENIAAMIEVLQNQ